MKRPREQPIAQQRWNRTLDQALTQFKLRAAAFHFFGIPGPPVWRCDLYSAFYATAEDTQTPVGRAVGKTQEEAFWNAVDTLP